jgi:hypothetical protein
MLFRPNLFTRYELGDGFTGSFVAYPGRSRRRRC